MASLRTSAIHIPRLNAAAEQRLLSGPALFAKIKPIFRDWSPSKFENSKPTTPYMYNEPSQIIVSNQMDEFICMQRAKN